MTIPPILKNKWVLLGGGGVILVALIVSNSSSGGSGAVAVTSASGPTDAQVAAQHDIVLAQISAATQQSAINGQLAIAQQQGQNDLAKAALEADLSRYAIDAQSALQALASNTARDVQLADLASQERRETASINAQTQLAKWTLDQATMNAQIQSDFQLQYAEAANQTNIQLSQMQANLVNNQLIANRDVTLAGLATQTDLATINANLQRDVTLSNNKAQASIYASMTNAQTEQTRLMVAGQTEQTRLMASAQKHGSTMGLLGGIVGGIASIFSDPRVKSDVVKVGEYPDGLGMYEYSVPWAEARQHGVMADEVAALRPWALGPVINGVQTVDYRAIG